MPIPHIPHNIPEGKVGKPEGLSGSQTENSSLVENNIAPSKESVNFIQKKERSAGQPGESEINQKSHQPFTNRLPKYNIALENEPVNQNDKPEPWQMTQDEIAPIEDAFDNLFSTIKTRETDKGVEMYSVRGGALNAKHLTARSPNLRLSSGHR